VSALERLLLVTLENSLAKRAPQRTKLAGTVTQGSGVRSLEQAMRPNLVLGVGSVRERA